MEKASLEADEGIEDWGFADGEDFAESAVGTVVFPIEESPAGEWTDDHSFDHVWSCVKTVVFDERTDFFSAHGVENDLREGLDRKPIGGLILERLERVGDGVLDPFECRGDGVAVGDVELGDQGKEELLEEIASSLIIKKREGLFPNDEVSFEFA